VEQYRALAQDSDQRRIPPRQVTVIPRSAPRSVTPPEPRPVTEPRSDPNNIVVSPRPVTTNFFHLVVGVQPRGKSGADVFVAKHWAKHASILSSVWRCWSVAPRCRGTIDCSLAAPAGFTFVTGCVTLYAIKGSPRGSPTRFIWRSRLPTRAGILDEIYHPFNRQRQDARFGFVIAEGVHFFSLIIRWRAGSFQSIRPRRARPV
jgi:hypothetical protein